MTRNLLEEIERDALDSKASVADALRKCVALGGRSGSTELRDWATRELRGYDRDAADFPPYRIVVAPIQIDAMVGFNYVRGKQISSTDLPDFARDKGISETLRMRESVGELEAMVRAASEEGGPIRLGIPGGDILVKMWETPTQQVDRMYWSVSPIAVSGIIDQIRTTLVELVAELRQHAQHPDKPSAEDVTNAVHVVVHGRRSRVNVTAAQSAGSGTADVTRAEDQVPPWWKRLGAVWWFIVGVATIAGTVFAWMQLR